MQEKDNQKLSTSKSKKRMRILLIESGIVRRLPLIERILRNKLDEAHIANVEVESAALSEQALISPTSIPETAGQETERSSASHIKLLTRKLLNNADLILVTAKEQRDFLTKFMDYNRWNSLHLFQAYCFGRNENLTEPECEKENDLLYRQIMDLVEDGCRKIAQRLAQMLPKAEANIHPLPLS